MRSEKESRPGPALRRSTPYNPGLHQLVENKQAWAEPLDEAAKAHGFSVGTNAAICRTMMSPVSPSWSRSVCALPANRRSEWGERRCCVWKTTASAGKQQAYVDCGLGECWLKKATAGGRFGGSGTALFRRTHYQLRAGSSCQTTSTLVEVWQTPLAEVVGAWSFARS